MQTEEKDKKTEDQTQESQEGKQPEPKTKEQIAAERLERYNKDPDSFIEKSELVIGAKKSPKGLLAFVAKTDSDNIIFAQGKLNRYIHNMLHYAEIQAAMDAKNKPEIITKPGVGSTPGGFFKGARRAFGGRH